LKLELDCFLESIKTGRTPPTDGYNGLRVVSVLEGASKSLKNGGKAVPIPNPLSCSNLGTEPGSDLTVPAAGALPSSNGTSRPLRTRG